MLKIKSILILFIVLFSSGTLFTQTEICDNGIDDDSDNLIDLNDPDCICIAEAPISMIPNSSFEEMNCCPDDHSQLDCASDWIQASSLEVDFIHTCNWLGWEEFPPPQPFPDGEGIMGFQNGRILSGTGVYDPQWKEYAGACLLRPLLKDINYRFEFDLGYINSQFSPPINFSFFGTTDCGNFPFGSSGCPSNTPEWSKLSDVVVAGGSTNVWLRATIAIIPEEDIYAIAMGPDCPPNTVPEDAYYFLDNLLLTEAEGFGLEIETVNHPCEEDFLMTVIEDPNFEYQWYKSGVALVGETSSELNIAYGTGIYQVRILDGNSCLISEDYEYSIPSFTSARQETICEGETYQFGESFLTASGFYLDTFLNVNNCDSIVSLDLEVIDEEFNSLEASILAGDIYQIGENQFRESGEYQLIFNSSLGCDSLVLLNLSTFEVFIPTAFSPNLDGLNDYFQPYSATGKIVSVEMEIYDRWGGLKFRGDRWDGSELNPGVYIYTMTLQFDYGAIKQYAGSITLLR